MWRVNFELVNYRAILIHLLCLPILAAAQMTVTELGALPERVSNNAVCEGFINDVPYLFSFGGIDSTKIYSGIHLRSFRIDLETSETMRIPDLPDTMGKIASAASRIGNVIYISGGYHVFSTGSETTSGKMHRYDIINNAFLPDGKEIPKATDDHVQLVWRDSLIYLITGWSNVRNIFDVQIYNPTSDLWMTGTSVPNNSSYKSFGASGVIVGDTIYYFGGATSDPGFGIQNQLRKGVIHPDDPAQIDWSVSVPDAAIEGYRMASTVVDGALHWIGGSLNTYNFDGIAYDGSGGVPPSNRDLYKNVKDPEWSEDLLDILPMDLRGIARINDTVQYVAGGMLADQMVSDKVYKLQWQTGTTSIVSNQSVAGGIEVFPNPFADHIAVRVTLNNFLPSNLEMYHENGQKVISKIWQEDIMEIGTDSLPDGVYFIKIFNDRKEYIRKVIKQSG
jgi:type IX secretion system substrate protein